MIKLYINVLLKKSKANQMFLKIKSFIISELINNENSRTVIMNKNIFLMIIIRVFSVLISLLFVPLYLKSIDRADYGILITLTSMIGWIGMLDIGFGNGLRNKLTIAFSKNELLNAKKYVSSAYAAVSFYIIMVTIVFLSISHLFSWSTILNVDASREREMYLLVNSVFVLFGFSFILGVINTIIFAIHQPAYQSLINLLTQIISFIVVLVAIKGFSITSIISIGILNSIISPLVLFGASIILFSTKLRSFAPRWKLIDIITIKEILSLGLKFFILQIITLILFSINNVIILHISGSESVVEYSIAYRYIDVLAIIFAIFITPVWSASSDAFAKNDLEWIRNTVRKMLYITLIIVLGGTLMVIFSENVFNIWLGEGVIKVRKITLILVLLFVTFRMLYQCYGYVINGSGKLKAQMSITFVLAVVYIPLAILLGRILGLYGILIISALTQLVNYIWSQQQYKHIINNTGNKFWHD